VEPPEARSLRDLDALVDDFFASPRASRKPGARRVLLQMLHACHAEGRPFQGWWPSWGCIQVYTEGVRGWGNASALRCVGGFFRYAFERDALSSTELLWLLCGLENARRGVGFPARVVEVPDTPAFHEARLGWALWEASRVVSTVALATGRSIDAMEEAFEPVSIAGVMLAAQDGVPLRFDKLDAEGFALQALDHAHTRGRVHPRRHVDYRVLPVLASILEHLPQAHAISAMRAEELAADLRALAAGGETEGEA